jgi:DNA (cytosine-5)-methyltransferase 1
LKALDLFAGAGGLSLGLIEAGLDVVAAVECDGAAAATYRSLHPNTTILEQDINTVDLSPFRGEIELVAGGPPCQPFSTGGLRRGVDDPRNGVPAMLAAIELLQPRAVLLENVPGLAGTRARGYLLRLLRRLRMLGYEPEHRILDAADYGVPQRRRRLVICATKKPGFNFPEATHGPGAQRPWKVVSDVLDLVQTFGVANPSIVTYAKRPDLRPSPYDGHLFNGGGRPLDMGKPSRTILASAGGNKTHFLDCGGVVPDYHAHLMAGGKARRGRVTEARRLTVAESALLQSFEPSTAFIGSRSQQYSQIGNAVPPLLAEAIGRSLLRHLRSSREPVSA